MKKFGYISSLCAFYFFVFSTLILSQSSKTDRTVIGKVGGEKITYWELKNNLNSSGPNKGYTLDDLKDFLPIYLDYKAKLHSAEDAGYFSDKELIKEYELYSKQAAYSQWLEKDIRPTLFASFAAHHSKELKSYHILVMVPKDAPPADTLAAYTKLIEARNKYLAGTPIEKLNQEYSSTRNGRSVGGELPWLSVGTTVKEFEDALYSLKIGEISMPFRTQFGYHIVLLKDERPRTPARRLSHIFTKGQNAKQEIDSAYSALSGGRNWTEVLSKYSIDKPSVPQGGNIGWIEYGKNYEPSFIDTVMSLDPEAPFSKPIKTYYGYHIFRVDSVQTFKTPEDKDAFLMKELEKMPYYKKNNTVVVNWLKEKYNAKVNDDSKTIYENLLAAKDSVKISNVSVPQPIETGIIFNFNGKKYSVGDYHTYLSTIHDESITNQYTSKWFDDYTTSVIDKEITGLTLKKFPDFVNQVNGYKNGLVVYKVNEDSVWSSATIDTTILVNIYNEKINDYRFDTRYFYYMVSSSRDSVLNKAIDFIKAGNSPDSLRANDIKVIVVSDSSSFVSDEPFDKLKTMPAESFSDIFDYNNRKAFFYLKDILPARRMTFDEAFNRVLSDYQPKREELWMERIRNKYKVEPNYKNLEKAFKKESHSK